MLPPTSLGPIFLKMKTVCNRMALPIEHVAHQDIANYYKTMSQKLKISRNFLNFRQSSQIKKLQRLSRVRLENNKNDKELK